MKRLRTSFATTGGCEVSTIWRKYRWILSMISSGIGVSDKGVLLSSLKDVKRILAVKSRQEEVLREDLVSFSLEWISLQVDQNQLRGYLSVLGEGDLYILYTNKQVSISSWDVVFLGQNVGSMD